MSLRTRCIHAIVAMVREDHARATMDIGTIDHEQVTLEIGETLKVTHYYRCTNEQTLYLEHTDIVKLDRDAGEVQKIVAEAPHRFNKSWSLFKNAEH